MNVEDKSNFKGYQIIKKEMDLFQLPIEDNNTLPQFHPEEEYKNLNDLEKVKVEGIDIKEEIEDHLDIETAEYFEYTFHQLGKQENSNDENLFLGFITENVNDKKLHILENKRKRDLKKQACEKNTWMLMDVPSLGPIKKHRRVNCGECDGCLKPDCRVCVYCKDKYKRINRLKQKCIHRKCFKFKLCSTATCYLCGSKFQSDSPKSIEDESEELYSLMECSICFRIAHIYCQENLCNGRKGKILTTKSNLWQCPECVPFVLDDTTSMEKKDTSLLRTVQCSQGLQEERKSNKFISKRQRKKDKISKVKTPRKPYLEILPGISFKEFKSITGRKPWNGYTVFIAMTSKRLNKRGKSEESLPFVGAKGLEWQQLPDRKKMVFREGAKKINRLLLKNAQNLLKMKKTTKSIKKDRK